MLLLASFAVAVGCSEKTTSKNTETIQGPRGTSEIERKATVKESGENPPNP